MCPDVVLGIIYLQYFFNPCPNLMRQLNISSEGDPEDEEEQGFWPVLWTT